jgi:site-specific recombinase XerD
VIPISSVLLGVLSALREESKSEFVFIKRFGRRLVCVRTAFTSACRHAKLSAVTPHTLRHTFGSRLVMAGVDLRTVQELGGWKDLKMVMRYSHLAAAHKSEAIEKLASFSDTLFTPAKTLTAVSY